MIRLFKKTFTVKIFLSYFRLIFQYVFKNIIIFVYTFITYDI